MRLLKPLATLALVASTVTLHAQDKAFLLDIEPGSEALLAAISGSGAVAVGNFNGGGGLYWMPTSGVVFIGGVFATGVSGDGRTIVGTALDANRLRNAAIWQRGAEWRMLGGLPNSVPCDGLSSALGVSRDGKVVVGSAVKSCTLSHAFRWDESSGMVDLGSVEGQDSRASAVSGDGKVVVGRQNDANGTQVGVRWVDGRQETFGRPVGPALAVNVDGTVVVGQRCRVVSEQIEQSAWIWTERDGIQCLLAPGIKTSIEGPVLTFGAAISDNGRVVAGGHGAEGARDAVLWIDGKESYLKDYLRAHGVPDAFQGWINTGEIDGVSPDGRVLVGWGAAIGGFRGYVVILPDLEPLK